MARNPYEPPQSPLESPQAIEAHDRGSEKKYVVGAVAIGIMQFVDAGFLFANEGAIGTATLIFSTIEFLWTIVSLYVSIKVKHSGTRLLALLFLTYFVLGSVVGVLLDVGGRIPIWTAVVGGVFGVAYAVAAGFVWTRTAPSASARGNG